MSSREGPPPAYPPPSGLPVNYPAPTGAPVRFAAPDGSVQSLGTGDALFVPRGASIGWESSERVAKFYVMQNVKPSTERE